mgnify:FL=1
MDYETECELGNCLGWRVNNSWLIHSQLTFQIQNIVSNRPPYASIIHKDDEKYVWDSVQQALPEQKAYEIL